MRAKLQVEPGEPGEPARAATVVARSLLAELPRQRPVTLGIVGFGPHPGLTPTPWVLDGLLEALLEAERTPVNLLTLADADTVEAALRRTGRELLADGDGRELLERPSPDRKLALRVPSRAGVLSLPRELVGSSLVLVCPLLLRREAGDGWLGPLALVAAELARAWGFAKRGPVPGLSRAIGGLRARERDDDAAASVTGTELLTAAFSSVSLLIDGTWAGVLASRERAGTEGEPGHLEGELAASERVLGLRELGRLGDDARDGVDQWLLRVLGLERGPAIGGAPAPDIDGSPGRWPTLELGSTRPSGPTRMADRAIAGIRSQSQRLRAKPKTPALPARVPGRFAGLWTRRWYDPAFDRMQPRATGTVR